MSNLPARVPPQDVITRIRGHAVILDTDLAALYGVPVKRLNEQVRRNPDRFPEPFAFRLTDTECQSLRSQTATLKRGQHRKYLPLAFTEHGAIMAANVLNSAQAIQMRQQLTCPLVLCSSIPVGSEVSTGTLRQISASVPGKKTVSCRFCRMKAGDSDGRKRYKSRTRAAGTVPSAQDIGSVLSYGCRLRSKTRCHAPYP